MSSVARGVCGAATEENSTGFAASHGCDLTSCGISVILLSQLRSQYLGLLDRAPRMCYT